MIADRNFDVELLASLMEGDAYCFLYEQCNKQGLTIHQYAEKLANNGTIAYALEGDKLIGYVIGYSSDPQYTTSFITQVYVDSSHRGMHLATELMNEYIAFCKGKGLKGVWLTTQNDNYPAQKLYLSLGFIIDGENKLDNNLIRLYLDF